MVIIANVAYFGARGGVSVKGAVGQVKRVLATIVDEFDQCSSVALTAVAVDGFSEEFAGRQGRVEQEALGCPRSVFVKIGIDGIMKNPSWEQSTAGADQLTPRQPLLKRCHCGPEEPTEVTTDSMHSAASQAAAGSGSPRDPRARFPLPSTSAVSREPGGRRVASGGLFGDDSADDEEGEEPGEQAARTGQRLEAAARDLGRRSRQTREPGQRLEAARTGRRLEAAARDLLRSSSPCPGQAGPSAPAASPAGPELATRNSLQMAQLLMKMARVDQEGVHATLPAAGKAPYHLRRLDVKVTDRPKEVVGAFIEEIMDQMEVVLGDPFLVEPWPSSAEGRFKELRRQHFHACHSLERNPAYILPARGERLEERSQRSRNDEEKAGVKSDKEKEEKGEPLWHCTLPV